LIGRFKEREENVKSDIFHAYIALLKATRPADDMARDPDAMDDVPVTIQQLQEQVPAIVKAVQPLMKEKSVKTRQDCFLLLRELLHALPGALSSHIDQLMPGINYSLSDKNTTSNMKIDALTFVHHMLTGHSPQVFHPHIQSLVPLIVNSVFDPFYKIATEALSVLQQLVKVVRPLGKLNAI
jgi:cullin-associated NEDD8-dissociated protein 1